MEQFISEHQEDKVKEAEERKALDGFIQQPDVDQVFGQYGKSL